MSAVTVRYKTPKCVCGQYAASECTKCVMAVTNPWLQAVLANSRALPSQRDGDVTFKNVGNSCYINASLQCLLHCESFVEHVTRAADAHRKVVAEHQHFCVLHELEQLLQLYLNGDAPRVIDPSRFVFGLLKSSSCLEAGRQEDASEFICVLLDQLDEVEHRGCEDQRKAAGALSRSVEQRVRETSTSEACFNGELFTVSTCALCARCSQDRTAFRNICLAPRANESVLSALRHNFSSHCVEEMHMRRCDACEASVLHYKQKWMSKTPRILNFHVNRFEGFDKSARRVWFPLHLDVSELSARAQLAARYRLVGVLEHRGDSAHSGHYVATVRTSDDGWLLMDDERSTPLRLRDVRNAQCYNLFYERC